MRNQIYIRISHIYFNFKKANKINVTPLNQERFSSVFSAILFPTKQPPNIAIIFIISENIIIWIKKYDLKHYKYERNKLWIILF